MNKPYQLINYCPRCGTEYQENSFNPDELFHKCHKCNFKLHHNSSPAAEAIIPHIDSPTKILISTRNIEPEKDKLDLIGGFSNYHENPKETVKREIEEEIGLNLEMQKLLFAKVSEYNYQNAMNSVLNIVFLSEPISEIPTNYDKNEIQSLDFYDLEEILEKPEEFAFQHQIESLKAYLDLFVVSTHKHEG